MNSHLLSATFCFLSSVYILLYVAIIRILAFNKMKLEATTKIETLRDWLHRHRWRNRLIITIIIAPFLGHFVYTRLTVSPPENLSTFYGPRQIPPAMYQNEATIEFEKQISRIPALPTVTVPSGIIGGKQWVHIAEIKDQQQTPDRGRISRPTSRPTTFQLDESEALFGEWKPETHFQLREIIKYLETPEVRDRLNKSAALCSGEISATPESMPPGWILPSLSPYRHFARLLTVRARYYLARKNDFDKAASDIEAILQLAANLEDDYTLITILVGMAIRSLAESEVVIWPGEYEINRDQIESLMQLFQKYPCSYQQSWERAVCSEHRYSEHLLNCLYTKQEDGNGWLIWHNWPSGKRVFCLYNLLSPIFDDRNTVYNRWLSLYEKFGHIADLSYPQAKRTFEALDIAVKRPTDLFGNRFLGLENGRYYYICVRQQADNDGRKIALALSAYHRDHNHYPDSLADLVPLYISTLPDDPFADQPFRYRLDDKGTYILYSVGTNGVDDGGNSHVDKGSLSWIGPKDCVIESTRSEPYDEWMLVPATPTTQQGNNERSGYNRY
ncbi:MAG: hypothetical protein JSV03_07175 [Planctomycetota bacterium]|nr:MAG: hypothetical protein JSV03_07175 [Planctomycetota bacterium]